MNLYLAVDSLSLNLGPKLKGGATVFPNRKSEPNNILLCSTLITVTGHRNALAAVAAVADHRSAPFVSAGHYNARVIVANHHVDVGDACITLDRVRVAIPASQQQQQKQQNLHQSLASHYHLLHLVENLAEVIEHGNPDQQSDALINELSNHFEKCQQLLNSISGSISTKAMTVEGQKKKLEESEQLLNQRRDLIANYKKSVEELVRSEP
ncbi:unnamed protein product [Sphenostylis stenocarpa]|uniref:Mediator of RNA polymerase II transcription subunit 9 n=1 Tax=Sphenostylis stenocarpa TaxID=92480 RepID=A0AA86SI75_9FABA|nr:unnamed protein product [Sphenostylis stenocarpa]